MKRDTGTWPHETVSSGEEGGEQGGEFNFPGAGDNDAECARPWSPPFVSRDLSADSSPTSDDALLRQALIQFGDELDHPMSEETVARIEKESPEVPAQQDPATDEYDGGRGQGWDLLDIMQLDITTAGGASFGAALKLLGVEVLLGLARLADRLGDLALGLAERWMWEVEGRGEGEKGQLCQEIMVK